MFFYRIENDKGCGPYNRYDNLSGEWLSTRDMSKYEFGHEWACKDHCVDNRTPSPYDDFGYEWAEGLDLDKIRFGFKSLDQLYSWFSEIEVNNLELLGYSIKRIQGEVVYSSDSQVVFRIE